MTAKYRPISPAIMWTSIRYDELNITERYVLGYLLTSPQSSSTGCYALNPRIASAEARLSQDEFEQNLGRLHQRKFIRHYRDLQMVLVRVWFDHNAIESVVKGNIGIAARKEIARWPMEVRQDWIAAALDVGVEQELIRSFLGDLAKGSGRSSEGLRERSPTEREQDRTQREQQPQPEQGGSRSDGLLKPGVIVDPRLRRHDKWPAMMRAVAHCDAQRQQALLDEIDGTLLAIQEGRRKQPIDNPEAWLGTLDRAWGTGPAKLNHGLVIKRRRDEADANAIRNTPPKESKEEQERRRAEGRKQSEKLVKVAKESEYSRQRNSQVGTA